MTSRVFNFLWLNLDPPFRFRFGDEPFREPMPQKYLENIRRAAAANPGTEVRLWVDARRLTGPQMEYLKNELAKAGCANLRLEDLRSIPAYNTEPLYNDGAYSAGWRDERKDSLIWRQVDAAKVLVSLQGDYDQVLYADIDFADIAAESDEVQDALARHGLLVRGFMQDGKAGFENQMWAFDRSRRDFFERLYERTLKSAHEHQNGYHDLLIQIRTELEKGEGIDLRELIFTGHHDGTSAWHPGHKWSHGHDDRRWRVSAPFLDAVNFKMDDDGACDFGPILEKKTFTKILPEFAVA